MAQILVFIFCGTDLIVYILWHKSYCWFSATRILLLVFCCTNHIVPHHHHSYLSPSRPLGLYYPRPPPVSKPAASLPASRSTSNFEADHTNILRCRLVRSSMAPISGCIHFSQRILAICRKREMGMCPVTARSLKQSAHSLNAMHVLEICSIHALATAETTRREFKRACKWNFIHHLDEQRSIGVHCLCNGCKGTQTTRHHLYEGLAGTSALSLM